VPATLLSGFQAALGRGDDRICIAVLDGPVDRSHPCFRQAKLSQLDTLPRQGSFDGQASSHGTHVASVIFGQPGSTVSGVAPFCRGLIIPIFADEPTGASLTCSQLDLARAILLAIENGAHVINISGGELAPSGEPQPMLAQAIASCVQHNVLIVAAAGNDGCECLHVPAATPTVLAVGAMDRDGRPLRSSNWGGAYRTQGILAPGVDVLGAVPGGGAARKSGTSFATPFVSGLVGLLASLQVKQGRPADPHAIRAALLQSALPCVPDTSDDCRRFLAGRVNIPAVLEHTAQGAKIMTNPESLVSSESAISPPGAPILQRPVAEPRPVSARIADGAQTISMSEEAAPASPLTAPARVSEPVIAPANLTRDVPLPPAIKTGPRQITLSDCGCGGGANCTCGTVGAQKPTLVYALGKLGYDFGTEARRDSFIQAMPANANNPLLPDQLLSHLQAHPYDAPLAIWTLNLDATPIYAIQPTGPFAASGYERLREFLHGQLREGVELVSVPGTISGSVRLQSGQVVPVIDPVIRGMYSWATKPLVEHVLGARPRSADERAPYDAQMSGLSDFLNRVYYDLRNLGVTAEERALNHSATNAVQIAEVVRCTTQEELDLDKIMVKKSPVCRPDSDCYDVELSFFNPNNIQMSNRIFRFTVDVSDVVPVTIGAVRSWTRRQ
jgi:cyanobactin maturation PatA/PatG family protease